MLKLYRHSLILTVLVTVLFLTANPCWSASPFKGETIDIIVGFSAGGSYDLYGRVVGNHISKYIEGNPTVIVKNMPGAGSTIAANFVYKKSKPNGLTIGLIDGGNAILQMVEARGAEFDLKKFEYIGGFSDIEVAVVDSKMSFKTPKDIFNAPEPVTFGHFGGGSFHTTFLSILMSALDSNAKLIGGYGGASEVIPAIERDEVDASALSWSTARRHVERGALKVVVRAGAYTEELKNAPSAKEIATTDRGKRMLNVLNGVLEARRILVLPPETPQELVNTLSEAFRKAMNDPKLLEQLSKAKRPSDFIEGAKAKQIMMEALTQPDEVVEAFKKLRSKK